ncbi:MAG: hypothetical protein ABL863_06505 [Nitrosomonas sp.]
MRMLTVCFAVFCLSACIHLIESTHDKPQRHEEKLAGEHSALASCVTNKLQSDSRSFMRILQFRNRKFSDRDISEIRAFDTRYLANIYPSNSPTNPDAVVNPASPNPEILPYAHRNMKNETVHAFILTLTKLNDATVNANLKGDQFLGNIAWKALQSCAGK